MKSQKILLVSKNSTNTNIYLTILRYNKYSVEELFDTNSLTEKISKNKYDLILIDDTSLDISACILCGLIRDYSSVPIMIILSNYNETNIVELFNYGIDDCLVKPVHTYEFLARIKHLIKNNRDEIVEINGLKYDKTNDTVMIGNKQIDLTQTEIKILKLLINHIGQTVSSKDLLEGVWGWSETSDTSVVATNINRLRNKIGKNKISTVRGSGYRLEC